MRRFLCALLGSALLSVGGPARTATAADPAPAAGLLADSSGLLADSSGLLADSSGLPADTQALLRRLPENTRFVVTLDVGDDNPSMAFARMKPPEGADATGGYASLEKARGDIGEGFSRILRLFGLDARVFNRLSESMGPRFILAAIPGATKNAPPDLLVLAGLHDRRKAEASLSTLIGSLARNAVETAEPMGSGQLHSWTGFPFMKTLKLSYLIGGDAAAIGTNLALLQGAATGRDSAPAWLSSLVSSAPRGVIDVYVSPDLPDLLGVSKKEMDPAQLGLAGAAAAVTFSEDGVLLTETAVLSKEGMLSTVMAGAANLPGISDAAFQRIPADSLAVVAVSSPSAWLKSFGGAGLLAPMMAGGPNSEAATWMTLFTNTFDGDTAVTLRSALPLPSVVAMVAGADSDSSSKKVAALLDLARKLKIPASEVVLSGGGRATALKIGRDPFENVLLSQQGNYGVLSTDRRTMEEVSGLAAGDSLAESAAFRSVRSHVGDKPNLLLYADLSPLSGMGMIASQTFYMGMPIGQELARLFSKVHGMGIGLEMAPDRITSRTFLSGEPMAAFPALVGLAVSGAGAAVGFRLMSALHHAPVVRHSPATVAPPARSKPHPGARRSPIPRKRVPPSRKRAHPAR